MLFGYPLKEVSPFIWLLTCCYNNHNYSILLWKEILWNCCSWETAWSVALSSRWQWLGLIFTPLNPFAPISIKIAQSASHYDRSNLKLELSFCLLLLKVKHFLKRKTLCYHNEFQGFLKELLWLDKTYWRILLGLVKLLKSGWENGATKNITSCFIDSPRTLNLKKLRRNVLVVGAWSSLRSLPSRDVYPRQNFPPGNSAQKSLTAWCREQGTQSKSWALTPGQPRKMSTLIFSITYLFLPFQEPMMKATATLEAEPPTLLKSLHKSINTTVCWPGCLRNTAPQNLSSQTDVSEEGEPSTTW